MEKVERLFVGIALDLPVKEAIARYQRDLKPFFRKAGWKDQVNFHITLKFLGDIFVADIPKIKEIVEEGTNQFYAQHPMDSFMLTIDHIGTFGMGSPKASGEVPIRVLWLGANDDNLHLLHALRNAIEARFVAHGFKEDLRPYAPHITLLQDGVALGVPDLDLYQQWLAEEVNYRALKSPLVVKGVTLFVSEPVTTAEGEQNRLYRGIHQVNFNPGP